MTMEHFLPPPFDNVSKWPAAHHSQRIMNFQDPTIISTCNDALGSQQVFFPGEHSLWRQPKGLGVQI
jgi:hypothetical protein